MEKLAAFIVDKRNLFFLLYIFALVFCFFSTEWVKVENDITTYLPAETETRRGLTIMNEEFITYGTAKVMVSNISYEKGLTLQDKLSEIEGVSGVEFDNTQDHFINSSALFDITFDGTASDEISVEAMNHIKDLLSGYDTYINTEVGEDTAAALNAGHYRDCRCHYYCCPHPHIPLLRRGSCFNSHLWRSSAFKYGY